MSTISTRKGPILWFSIEIVHRYHGQPPPAPSGRADTTETAKAPLTSSGPQRRRRLQDDGKGGGSRMIAKVVKARHRATAETRRGAGRDGEGLWVETDSKTWKMGLQWVPAKAHEVRQLAKDKTQGAPRRFSL